MAERLLPLAAKPPSLLTHQQILAPPQACSVKTWPSTRERRGVEGVRRLGRPVPASLRNDRRWEKRPGEEGVPAFPPPSSAKAPGPGLGLLPPLGRDGGVAVGRGTREEEQGIRKSPLPPPPLPSWPLPRPPWPLQSRPPPTFGSG